MTLPTLLAPQATNDYRAALAAIAAQVQEQHPRLETWVLAKIGDGRRYTYESWYQPEDRPFVWRGKRGPKEK